MALNTVRIWDLPTRLFHWLLLVCVAGLFATAYVPGASIDVHARFGYGVLALLLFRLVWGLVGGHWSRFRNFLPTPSAVAAYLRSHGRDDRPPGHNPLGALAVLAMLLALAVQVATGLISDDEIAFTGPLNRFASTAQGLSAMSWHKGWGQWLIVGLVTLHVAAIAFYAVVRRDNLVRAMVGGDKVVTVPAVASRDTLGSRLLALGVAAMCGALVYLVVRPVPGF